MRRERILARWRSDPDLTVREVAALFGIGVDLAARLRRIALGCALPTATLAPAEACG
jgi:hypothetical protein